MKLAISAFGRSWYVEDNLGYLGGLNNHEVEDWLRIRGIQKHCLSSQVVNRYELLGDEEVLFKLRWL